MQLNSAIERLLKVRGISAADDVAEFLSEKPQKTYNPFLLPNMEEGVDLILSAIEDEKKICIYGDYDSDGVTSVALLRDVLKELGADVTYYIPSRFDDGYGLNSSALEKIKGAGVSLVITVDCGCTSVDEVEHAKSIGLDIMVTDHHTPKEEVPDCIVIDPLLEGSEYPFKYLAGVGVAFKLAQALVESTGASKEILTRNLDLLGIGTIVDIVPLIDENRTFAKYGLRALKVTERAGIKALLDKLGIKRNEITSRTISYIIGPHINAAGRVDNATLAARLLQTEDYERALSLTDELIGCNMKRKSLQDELQKACYESIDDETIDKEKFILISPKSAHEGIIGIVAGKLKEDYSVPVLITTPIGDGIHKGTGRSPSGVNLFKLLTSHSELFTRLGGHSAACGFSIPEENLPKLREILKIEMEELIRENPDALDSTPEAEIIMNPEEITKDFMAQQKLLEPFGKDNDEPMVGVELRPFEIARMGDGRFIRFNGKLGSGSSIRGVDFRKADEHEGILKRAEQENSSVTAVGNLGIQTWNDKEYIQLVLKAIKS
ncbi:MAG: single-stranded-DNA-specific exonuclease RecJ [Firmicutes bacterium]|nr:single-stranded-DNA-specific exonuclease RecJ [Bacillota bacterium]